MKTLTLLLVLLSVAIYVECRSRRREYKRERESDDDSDSDNSFDRLFNSRRYYRQNFFKQRYDEEKKYTKLKLDRKQFYYWDTAYTNWTQWTVCNPATCLSKRNRTCKDNSWQEKVLDFRFEEKCPVKVVLEQRRCFSVKECKIDRGTRSSNDSRMLPKECGIRNKYIQTKIIGGSESIPNSWPWHGGLYVKNGRRPSIYICGATLINQQWAVTAAHCLRTVGNMEELPLGAIIDTQKYGLYDTFELVFGDHDRLERGRKEKVSKISHFIIHPSFVGDATSNIYDVVLLKLEKVIPRDENIDFPCIPEFENYTLPISTKCQAIGWGYQNFQEPIDMWSFEFDWFFERYRERRQKKVKRNQNILQEVEIPLVDFKDCQKVYRNFKLQNDTHLCAGEPRKDTCRGDSGGGLFCRDPKTFRWQLYGITNFGTSRGCGKSYGVYVRVATLTRWIQNTLKSVIA